MLYEKLIEIYNYFFLGTRPEPVDERPTFTLILLDWTGFRGFDIYGQGFRKA